MVRQISFRKILRSIFKHLKFLRKKIFSLPLEIHLDVDENMNDLLIEVFMNIDNEKVYVPDISKMKHGFSVQRENRIYYLDGEELIAILAIHSLNPRVTEDGKLIAKINPSILKFLRGKKQIKESELLKRLKIHDTPLKKCAEIKFNPKSGLNVKIGYELPNINKIILEKQLIRTQDGSYVRYENEFFPYVEETDSDIKELLQQGELTIPLNKIPEFFKKDLVLIKSNFKAVLEENVKQIIISEEKFIPVLSIDIDTKGWLKFVVEYKVGKYTLPHDLFKKRAKYVQVDDTTWLKVDWETINKTETELKNLNATYESGRFLLEPVKFYSLETFIKEIGGVRIVTKEYQKFLDEITDFQYNENYQLPENIEDDLLIAGIKLRKYQRAGIHWLNWLIKNRLHGILADDMGLGKTIEMILAIRIAYEETNTLAHSLVICPRSVVKHWSREINRVFPNMLIFEYLGPERHLKDFEKEKPHIFITTYATATRDIDILKKIPFFFVVLDEGTQIKNPRTRRAQAVKLLNSAHRFVLTGTPIENRPAELWSIFDFLMRGHLGRYHTFIKQFEEPIVSGNDQVAEELSKRIKPFILRRTKEQVAKELPEKIQMNEWCKLTEEQRALYGQIQNLYVPSIITALRTGANINYTKSILPVITKLKQVCIHPALITNNDEKGLLGRSEKFDFTIEKIENITENNESVVLFSHFLGALDLFEQFLINEDIPYIRIDGSTRNRQELIDKFNEKKASVALCSTLAAGHGINLIAANHVIHVDRWWNPAVEDQATDRVHRIGQVKTVYVYKILTEGTLEERIDRLIEKKRKITDKVIGATMRGEWKWTREELIEILKPIDDYYI